MLSPRASTYPVLGVGFVGKQNKPLFIRSFDEDAESDLEVNLTVHSCLDVIDERAEPSTTPYLGFLSLMGRHATYGYIGPTRVKVFCVLDADTEPAPREEEMKQLLHSLHHAYVDWLCNPFIEIDLADGDPVPIDMTEHFTKRVKRACETNGLVTKPQF